MLSARKNETKKRNTAPKKLGARRLAPAARPDPAPAAGRRRREIDRDGALQGVNVQATADLARAISIPVIASGGVASLDDLRGLMAVAESGIEGVISGRALYDGRIDLTQAIAVLDGKEAA